MEVIITPSKKKDNKYDANIKTNDTNTNISFGAKGMKDYTLHTPNERDERKNIYIRRHKKRADWTKSGIDSAGFYNKHVLWNKPTFKDQFNDLKSKYHSINVTYEM